MPSPRDPKICRDGLGATSESRSQAFDECFLLRSVDRTTENQFGIRMTINFTGLCGNPGELDILEVDIASAKRIECLVNSLLGRKNHRETLLQVAGTDPVEFGTVANQFAYICSFHPSRGF